MKSLCRRCLRSTTVREELSSAVTICTVDLVEPNAVVESCTQFKGEEPNISSLDAWEREPNGEWVKYNRFGDKIAIWSQKKRRRVKQRVKPPQLIN